MSRLGIEPGDLQELVTILEDTGSAQDALAGRGAPNFTALSADSEEYARIKPISARTRMMFEQHGSPAEYEVTIRYRDDVDTRNRLRWDSNADRVLILVSGPIDAGEGQEYLTFTAKEDRD
jgi:SPP1 family predicted phage head-tail adaptor